MIKLRIITNNSQGLLNDANTYKNIFEKNNYKVDIYTTDNNISYQYYDLNLFLEHIYPNDIISRAKKNLFMPNQEFFFFSVKHINKIDYVLCKTKISSDFFVAIKKLKKYKYRCVYTKFTTNINKSINVNVEKDVNLFVQLAGKSQFKNTASLIICWLKNNGFVDIDNQIKLYITCYNNCYKILFQDALEYHNIDLLNIYPFEKIENGIKFNNLIILNNKNNMYEYLLTKNSLSICISDQEGFGHYINEARYYNSAVLTVDHPPMNELVKDGENGFTIKNLIKSEKKINKFYSNVYPLYKVYPDLDELKNKIIYCIKNKNNLINYGKIGHKMFIKDNKYFNKKMTLFIGYLNDILLNL
jgi:glycosyltransferase involved in cell wall biosynthesis